MIHKQFDYREHQKERVINKRVFTITKIWKEPLESFSGSYGIPGRWNKNHLGCSCWMCSKIYKTKYAGNKRAELRKLEREKDIE